MPRTTCNFGCVHVLSTTVCCMHTCTTLLYHNNCDMLPRAGTRIYSSARAPPVVVCRRTRALSRGMGLPRRSLQAPQSSTRYVRVGSESNSRIPLFPHIIAFKYEVRINSRLDLRYLQAQAKQQQNMHRTAHCGSAVQTHTLLLMFLVAQHLFTQSKRVHCSPKSHQLGMGFHT